MAVISGALPANGSLYSDHVLIVTLEWSEIMNSYNTPDTAVRDRRQK